MVHLVIDVFGRERSSSQDVLPECSRPVHAGSQRHLYTHPTPLHEETQLIDKQDSIVIIQPSASWAVHWKFRVLRIALGYVYQSGSLEPSDSKASGKCPGTARGVAANPTGGMHVSPSALPANTACSAMEHEGEEAKRGAHVALELVLGSGSQVHGVHVGVVVHELLQHLAQRLHARCQPHQPVLYAPHPLQAARAHLTGIIFDSVFF